MTAMTVTKLVKMAVRREIDLVTDTDSAKMTVQREIDTIYDHRIQRGYRVTGRTRITAEIAVKMAKKPFPR